MEYHAKNELTGGQAGSTAYRSCRVCFSLPKESLNKLLAVAALITGCLYGASGPHLLGARDNAIHLISTAGLAEARTETARMRTFRAGEVAIGPTIFAPWDEKTALLQRNTKVKALECPGVPVGGAKMGTNFGSAPFR